MDTVENRTAYFCIVSFLESTNASATIAARDETHARELIEKVFEGKQGLKIIDLYPMKDAPKTLSPIADEGEVNYDDESHNSTSVKKVLN